MKSPPTDQQLADRDHIFKEAQAKVEAGMREPFFSLPYSRKPNGQEQVLLDLWHASRQGEHFDEKEAHPFVRQLMAFAETVREHEWPKA